MIQLSKTDNTIEGLTTVNKLLFETLVIIKQVENKRPNAEINKLIIDAMKELRTYDIYEE